MYSHLADSRFNGAFGKSETPADLCLRLRLRIGLHQRFWPSAVAISAAVYSHNNTFVMASLIVEEPHIGKVVLKLVSESFYRQTEFSLASSQTSL